MAAVEGFSRPEDRTAITFALSPSQASDAKAGRELLAGLGPLHLIMDRAYEDNEARQLALDFGQSSAVPQASEEAAQPIVAVVVAYACLVAHPAMIIVNLSADAQSREERRVITVGLDSCTIVFDASTGYELPESIIGVPRALLHDLCKAESPLYSRTNTERSSVYL